MKDSSQSSENIVTDLENPLPQPTEISKILASLEQLLESMRNNHSVISQLATSWGELSIWLKIGGALAVFGSLLLIGILTLSTLLIVTTCICTALYTLVSMALDNHHSTNKDEFDNLKTRITSLGSFLGSVIETLNDTSLKLSTDVDRLNNVVQQTQINFENEVSRLKTEEELLKQHNEVLGRMVKSITSHFTEHQESNQTLKDILNRHLDDVKEGKADFLDVLGNIRSLEKDLEKFKTDLNESYQRHEVLLKKYDGLVEQYQQQLTHEKKILCSTGTQTEPGSYTAVITSGIFKTGRDILQDSDSKLVACSQQTLGL